jgi:hypothetical protein
LILLSIFKEVASGKWTENEDQTLVTALKNVTGVDDISKLKCLEIPWRKVAEQVPSRHEEQCRSIFSISLFPSLKMYQFSWSPYVPFCQVYYNTKM